MLSIKKISEKNI